MRELSSMENSKATQLERDYIKHFGKHVGRNHFDERDMLRDLRQPYIKKEPFEKFSLQKTIPLRYSNKSDE